MITVKLDEQMALDILMDRLDVWTDDPRTKELFKKMYENYIDGGVFENVGLEPMVIVDNDYSNYCTVVDQDDNNFGKIKELFGEKGCCDVSCDEVGYSFIESADDEDDPTAFLMRY